MSDRAKIRARRVTGNSAQQQSDVAMAIKNARELALLPYAHRVTQQRGGRRDRGDRGDRGDDRGGRPPVPKGPPPQRSADEGGDPSNEASAEVGAPVEPVDEEGSS
jgi:small subunit ribosomal protein S18